MGVKEKNMIKIMVTITDIITLQIQHVATVFIACIVKNNVIKTLRFSPMDLLKSRVLL